MAIGEIKPDKLRDEIIFARKQVKEYTKTLDHRFKVWTHILDTLVKRIVPVE